MRKYRYTPLLIVLSLILAVLTYAFANSNSVDPSVAGDGSGTINPAQVTDIQYDLDATDPTVMTGVSFVVTGPTSASPSIYARIEDGAATPNPLSDWAACTLSGGRYVCTFAAASQPDVLPAMNLHVVAAD